MTEPKIPMYISVQLENGCGNITRINNVLNDLPKKLEGAKSQLENIYSQQEAAKQELEKPFALANELKEKEARLALLNADLNIDGNGGFDVMNDADTRSENEDEIEPESDDEYDEDYESGNASAKSVRPKFVDELRSFNAEKNQYNSGKQKSEHDI